MINSNYFISKPAISGKKLSGKSITANLRTQLDNDNPTEYLKGEIGGTKYQASSYFNRGMEFATYDADGEGKSEIAYNQDGSIRQIMTYNEDGDFIVLQPSKIKYEGGEKIGDIMKSGDGDSIKPLNLVA
ncbi:hypothetical protein II906_07140 [bacterium]|nr:hypothetical protein [bacterium]